MASVPDTEEEPQRPQCRSKSPEGERCTKLRGHAKKHHIRGTSTSWSGGIHTPAKWPVPIEQHEMSEGEWQAYGRFGY